MIAIENGTLKVDMNSDGGFDVNGVAEVLVVASVGPVLYSVAADALKEAVNRTPILTGQLRSTGSIRLEGSPNDLMRMQLASSLRSKPKKSGSVSPGAVSVSFAESPRSVGMKCMYAMQRSGKKQVVIKIGFHTSYARRTHEGDWQYLGARSSKANKKRRRDGSAGRYAGKVGKGYLKRSWTDNEGRYLSFIKAKVGR